MSVGSFVQTTMMMMPMMVMVVVVESSEMKGTRRVVRLQQQRRSNRDGCQTSRLWASRAASFLHLRRRLPHCSRPRGLSAATQPIRQWVQRVLPVEGERRVHRHQVLVSTVRAASRRRQTADVVLGLQQVVESPRHMPPRSMGRYHCWSHVGWDTREDVVGYYPSADITCGRPHLAHPLLY